MLKGAFSVDSWEVRSRSSAYRLVMMAMYPPRDRAASRNCNAPGTKPADSVLAHEEKFSLENSTRFSTSHAS